MLFLFVVGGSVALAALDAFDGYRSLRAARGDLLSGRSDVLERRLDAGRRSFAAAADRLRSPVLLPIRILPVFGRQITAFSDLASAAAQVSEIGRDAVGDLPALDGRVTRDRRIELARDLARAARRTADRLDRVDAGDDDWLVSPLARQHARFSSELDQVRSLATRGAVVADGMVDFLTGPRRYLVFAANNAEMRAGHGMFLSAGTLTVEDGAFALGEMEPTAAMRLEDGAVDLRGDMADLWGSLHPEREWRNLGLSPRFDTSARLASQMWQARTGESVDGVLAVDAVGVRSLLRATGPVTIDGQRSGVDNVVAHVLHDQYVGVPATRTGTEARREQLAELASAAVGNFDAGRWTLEGLLPGLADAGAGRHLLAWSRADGPMWEAAGVDGSLGEDSVLVAVLNRGGNKLDQFLDVRSRLVVEPGDGGTQRARLRVRVANETPDGEPGYIAGPHPLVEAGAGEYVGILAVTLPGSARNAGIEGVRELTPGGRDGPTTVVGTRIRLAQGASRTWEVVFQLPGSQRDLVIEPSARLPATAWRFGDDSFRDTERRRVVW